MAPGILPATISPLRKSSMAESFSRDNSAPGGGPSSAVAADKGAANETAATTAVNRVAKGQVDTTLRGNICWPDRSAGPSDVIALLQSDPDGRGRLRSASARAGFVAVTPSQSRSRKSSEMNNGCI